MLSARPLRRAALLTAALLVSACSKGFQVNRYAGNTQRLFQVSLQEFRKRHWENAATGFERLTNDLSARDTLLPLAHYYLGQAQSRKGDHLLAAQSYSRLAEQFPDDSLADDAILGAGKQYQELWRKPALDAQYGLTAITTYQTLVTSYPDSPLRPRAEKGIADLRQWLAVKDFDTGMHYFRRKAYDSAIIYFKDVVATYPNVPKSKEAYVRLLDAYRRIHYAEDAKETCDTLRTKYPGDGEVRRVCGGAPAPAAPASAAAGRP